MTPAASERRTVAVLFSDLSGFTRMAQTMDPEDVQELVDALFRVLRAEVERQGGTVDKFIGDAVMAVFGAPSAHGDDASRAVRAGLAMQRATAAFARERNLDLRLRVGINLGEVMWGSVGGAAPTAMGDPVNLAQRLETAAPPGSVLVSRAVERAARRDARFRFVGTIDVKGREGPVEAFAVEEDLPGRTEYRGVPGVASEMVGRAEELGRLLAPLEAGRGACVLVEADAGMGKSRLLAELRRAVRARVPGAWVAVGRAHEGIPVPLGPFGEIAREGLAPGGDLCAHLAAALAASPGVSEVDRENVADLMALSLGHPRPGSRVAGLDPERRREETLRAWRRWIAARAGDRPAVLCLEDLHWADPMTRELVEDLAARPPAARLLLVGASRPGPALLAGCELLALHELPFASVRELATAVLESPPDDSLARMLADQTGGHPYYVEELCHWLRENRLIEGSPARLASAPSGIPESLLGLLTARLDALPPPDKETLKAASVLGRVFWEKVLEEVLGISPAAALERARAARLIQAADGSAIPGDREQTFRHALIREAAYALVPRRERARLHAKFAELLESRAGTAGRRAKAMAAAQHEAAGRPADAARLWLDAAREANDDSSPREGLAHAEAALRMGAGSAARIASTLALVRLGRNAEALREAGALRDDPDAGIRTEAHLAMATTLDRLGRPEEALRAIEVAAGLAAAPETRWRAALARAYALHSCGRWREAAREGEDIASALAGESARPASPLARTLAGAHGLVAAALWNLGDYPRAAEAARSAIALRRAAGDRGGLARSLASYGAMQAMADRAAEGLEMLAESLALQREIGDRVGQVMTLASIADARLRLREYDPARDAARESGEIAREVGDRAGATAAVAFEARVALARADYAAALPLAETAVRLSPVEGSGLHIALARLALGYALAGVGRHEEAARELRAGLAIAEAVGHRWNELDIRCALGHSLRFAGQEAEALAVLDEGVRRAQAWAHPMQEAMLRLERHELRRRAGLPRGDDAEAALRIAEPMKRALLLREALCAAAVEAELAGRREEARAAARRALGMQAERLSQADLVGDSLVTALMHAVLGDSGAARESLAAAAALPEPGADGVRALVAAAGLEVERLLRGA